MRTIELKGPVVDDDTGMIYDWIGWQSCYPAKVKRELSKAGGEDVVLQISSPGGACIAGYEIYQAIREYTGKVVAHVVCACSIATLVVCAADEALAADAAVFMIHNASAHVAGDYRDMNSGEQMLREINDGIINAYIRKTGMEREKLQSMMDKNTWMGPRQAIRYGFLDGFIHGDPSGDADLGGDVVDEVQDFGNVLNMVIAQQPVAKGKIGFLAAALRQAEAANNTTEMKGEKQMTLKEMLKEHPELKAELDAKMEAARNEGVQSADLEAARNEGTSAERKRIQSLDEIAHMVSAEALMDAKYGGDAIDGKTLLYNEAVANKAAAGAYFKNALADAADSNAQEVGMGKPDAGESAVDEADELAGYVNRVKGGRKNEAVE